MKLHEALQIDLTAVNETLRDVVISDPDMNDQPLVHDHVLQIIEAGGKRLRPMMVIVGSRFGEASDHPAVLRTAAMLEYLHTASLIHDDIIDRADLRRGVQTLHTVTDVHTAVYIANYMMARAVEWAAEAGERQPTEADKTDQNVRYCMELVSIVPELCLGEYVQLRDRFNFDMTMDAYLQKTRSKTALLMAHCLKAGGKAAMADDEVCQMLFAFGEAVGMTFQIRDDVLDYTQPEEAIGKPAGSDLRNGNVTLPVLYALEDPAIGNVIRALGKDSPDDAFREAIRLVQRSSALDRALALAKEYAERSRAALDLLSSYPACRDLRILSDYFLQ